MIFLRVGYPLSKQIVKDTLITPFQKQKICELLDKRYSLEFEKPIDTGAFDALQYLSDYESQHAYDEILDALAYYILRERGYGGRERQLFTQYKPELLDKWGYVVGRKVYQTGVYNYPSPDEEYIEPAYLSRQKSHVVFDVDIHDESSVFGQSYPCIFTDTVRIENINLQKL